MADPTYGYCTGLVGFRIDNGFCEDVRLDDLTVLGTFYFPRAIHHGQGVFQPIIDERADEAQRNALFYILSGEDQPVALLHGSAVWAHGRIKWSSQHLEEGVAMGTRKRRSDRAGRGVLRSLGRPGVARREDRRRFWAAIAAGFGRGGAARRVGVSPGGGGRWVWGAGGGPPPGRWA